MTERELAELETHLAAGCDIATAMAAVDREQPGPRWLAAVGFAAALLTGLLILWLSR